MTGQKDRSLRSVDGSKRRMSRGLYARLRFRLRGPSANFPWASPMTGPPPRCRCDGASYYTPEQNAARIPFIVNNACPIHAAAS